MTVRRAVRPTVSGRDGDGYLAESPAEHVRRPKSTPSRRPWASTAWSSAPFLAQAAAARPVDHAVACLLGVLGLRVSEACGIDVEHLGTELVHRTVTVVGKGSKVALIPLPPRVARAIDAAMGERASRAVLLSRPGRRLDRQLRSRTPCRELAPLTPHAGGFGH